MDRDQGDHEQWDVGDGIHCPAGADSKAGWGSQVARSHLTVSSVGWSAEHAEWLPSLSGGEEEGMAEVPHQPSTTGGLGFSHGYERAPWGGSGHCPKSEPVWTSPPYHRRLPGLQFSMSAGLCPQILQSPTKSCTQEIVPPPHCQGPFSLNFL